MERESFASICWKEKRVIAISFFIALSQFQYGFDNAAVSGFQGMLGWLMVYGHVDPTSQIGYNIDTTVHTLIQSLLQLGGLVSCIFIFTFGASISRRLGIWTASVFGLVATAIQIGSTTLAALYIGRLLLGVSNGLFVTYSITYMSEIAPAAIRGSIVGMVTLHTSFGALLGILIDNYTQVRLDRMSYQIPLIVMLVIPVLISVGLVFLDDTPRYYISRGQDDKAAASIRKMRGIKDESQVRADVAHIKAAWEAEREMYRESRLVEAFKGTYLRRTMICIGVSIGQTATGIIFISSFSVYFFIQADIGSPFKWVMYSLVIALFANFLSFPALRWVDRRILLVVGSLSSAALMFAIAAVYTVDQRGAAAASRSLVALSIVYTWVYGISQGPTLWSIQAEVPPQRLRSQVVGLATGCNFIFAWLCAYCTPYFINPTALNWGPKYCYIWGGSNALLAVWVYFCVPETRGTTLEDLDELFESNISARKSARFRAMHRSDHYAGSVTTDVEKERNIARTELSVDEMSQTKTTKV